MLDKPIQKLGCDELERLYRESEDCDKRLFAEMRTNLQLVAGEHYARQSAGYWNRLRGGEKNGQDEQKIRLTKNHIQRITGIYCNSMETYFPGVTVVAKNEKELSHQKAAELHLSVWQDWGERNDLQAKISESIKNFVEIGEVAAKVIFNPDLGHIIGQEAEMQMNDESGEHEPVIGDDGEIKQTDTPVYSGEVMVELIPAYMLKRDKGATNMNESPYIIVTKMVSKDHLFTLVTDTEDRKEIEKSTGSEYTVFDNNTGTYRNVKDLILLKEIYWRPCKMAPKGYFQFFTDQKVVAQGELPEGEFPIVWEGFNQQTGNARAHSLIRHIRPGQVEVNRCASKMAEHQVTLGDDKVYIKSNAKITQGGLLPGVRINYVTGEAPQVFAGRTGDQYLPYLSAQVEEMYTLANVKEEIEEKPQQQDLYTQLFTSMKDKKKFVIYSNKIERFWTKVARIHLKLTKCYLSPEAAIPIIGKCEYVNLDEFKSADDLAYTIKVVPRTDDIETQFGKQLVLNHTLQYVGPNLGKDDIGMMLRLSPFLNNEKMFQKFTQAWDNITNDILALDRGKWVPPHRYDDHPYVIEQLKTRMKQADFEQLPMSVQNLYNHKMDLHEQMQAQKVQELQRAEAGFIPSGGFAVACDFYVSDPKDPAKTKRVRLPSESVNWLVSTLEKQGTMQNELQGLGPQVQTEIASHAQPGGGGQQPAQPQHGGNGQPHPNDSGGPLPLKGHGMAMQPNLQTLMSGGSTQPAISTAPANVVGFGG